MKAAPSAAMPGRVSPVLVATKGRTEYAVRCPSCDSWHRHASMGEKKAPCGTAYNVAPRRGRRP